VLGGGPAAAGVASLHHGAADVFGELSDLQWGGFVDTSIAPPLVQSSPVGVVDASCSRADRSRHPGDVLGERRDQHRGRLLRLKQLLG
jgi:hypothetical protein